MFIAVGYADGKKSLIIVIPMPIRLVCLVLKEKRGMRQPNDASWPSSVRLVVDIFIYGK
jgi:hypothetical protein